MLWHFYLNWTKKYTGRCVTQRGWQTVCSPWSPLHAQGGWTICGLFLRWSQWCCGQTVRGLQCSHCTKVWVETFSGGSKQWSHHHHISKIDCVLSKLPYLNFIQNQHLKLNNSCLCKKVPYSYIWEAGKHWICLTGSEGLSIIPPTFCLASSRLILSRPKRKRSTVQVKIHQLSLTYGLTTVAPTFWE